MSSNHHTLRFGEQLTGIRVIGPAPVTIRTAVRPEDTRTAERARLLAEKEAELSRREQELALAQQEVAAKSQALDEKLTELASLISSVKREKADMLEDNEEEIVTFSLRITEKVLQHEIEHGRYKIGEVVKSALQAARDRGAVVVRVNPRDLELTRAAVDRLEKHFGNTRITTVPDESICLASCCIETDSGKIFSEIPGRLERIEQSLLRKNGDDDGV